MTVRSGFFNSVDGDRLYSADEFNNIFEGILQDGVFRLVGDAFDVSPLSDMQVLVGSGRAWFNQSWIDSDTAEVITISPSYATLSRIDIIVLEINKTLPVRENSIMVIEGELAASPIPPVLANTLEHKQYPLAHITVSAGSIELLEANILNKVGTPECPYARGILEETYSDDITDLEDRVDVLEHYPREGRNIIINGDFISTDRGYTHTFAGDYSGYTNCADRWRFHSSLVGGEWRVQTETGVAGSPHAHRTYKITRTAVNPAFTNSNRQVYFSQRIAYDRLFDAGFNTVEAKPLTLSFKFKSSVVGTYNVELSHVGYVSVVQQYVYYTPNVEVDIVLTFPAWDIASFGTMNIDMYEEALSVNFWVSAGSISTTGPLKPGWFECSEGGLAPGQINIANVLDAVLYYRYIQLEIGEYKTPFEVLPMSKTFELCRRYYEKISSYRCMFIGAPNNVVVSDRIRYLVTKRYTPTVTITSSAIKDPGVITSPSIYMTDARNLDEWFFVSGTLSGASIADGEVVFGNISCIADAEL